MAIVPLSELLGQPALLYIDEATSGLDAGTERRMMRLFRGLADEGRSLICITSSFFVPADRSMDMSSFAESADGPCARSRSRGFSWCLAWATAPAGPVRTRSTR